MSDKKCAVDWTPEAIEAALDAYMPAGVVEIKDERNLMRAALDAAIEAQGLDDAFNAGVVSTFEQRAKDLEETYANARAEAFEEAAAFIEGKGGVIPGVSAFARLLSRNNQPCMSGDARDRLNRLDRRAFDEATDALATAIRALVSKG